MRTPLRLTLRMALAAVIVATSLTIAGGPASADSIQFFKVDKTGFCLDDSQQFGIRTFPCNGSNYQNWNVHVWGDNTRQLRNIATNRCIGASRNAAGNPQPIYGPCDSSVRMSWIIGRPFQGGGIKFIPQGYDTWHLCENAGNYEGGRSLAMWPSSASVIYRECTWR